MRINAKSISSLLAGSILLSMTACSNSADVSNDTTVTGSDAVTAITYNTPSEKVTALYGAEDFGGYEFRILSPEPGKHFYHKIGSTANEIYVEEDSGDILESAIYKRNVMTEDLLNISITPIFNGDTYTTDEVASKSILAGSDDFDMTLMPLAYSYQLAAEGMMMDLNSVDALDLDNEWWSSAIINSFTINDRLYAVTGHYNIFDDFASACVFYNEYMIDENQHDDIPALVRAGKWTIDAMMEMAAVVTNDINGDSISDINDCWGFMDNSDAVSHLLEGMDCRLVDTNAQGEHEILLGNEYTLTRVEKIYNKVITSGNALVGIQNKQAIVNFSENRCLFYYELLGAINEMRNMEKDFGIAPVPKYDETQEAYTSVQNNIWCTALSIPVTVSDAEKVGTVMEVLSGYSTETVNTTLYELMLGAKLVRNEEAVEMMDYIFASKQYDLAHGFDWRSSATTIMRNVAKNASFSFASEYASIETSLKQGFDDFMKAFEK